MTITSCTTFPLFKTSLKHHFHHLRLQQNSLYNRTQNVILHSIFAVSCLESWSFSSAPECYHDPSSYKQPKKKATTRRYKKPGFFLYEYAVTSLSESHARRKKSSSPWVQNIWKCCLRTFELEWMERSVNTSVN